MGGALVRRYAARQMMNPPLFCTHRERHGSSTAPFAHSLPLTLALIPNPSSGALQATSARRRREPRKPGRIPSSPPDSFRSFTSIAPRRTHSAPVVYWSWLIPDEMKMVVRQSVPEGPLVSTLHPHNTPERRFLHSDPSHAHRPRIVGAYERQKGARTHLIM